MLPNPIFDIIHAIEAKSEGLAVYDTYIKDAQHMGCTECVNMWKQMKQRDEEDLMKLTHELEKHVKQGDMTKGMSHKGTTTTTTTMR